MGDQALQDAVWQAHVDGRGLLFYWYEPSAWLHDLPISRFSRARVSPSAEDLHFYFENAQRAAWPGLKKVGGLDAYRFIESFELTKAAYDQLASLEHSMGHDVQAAACAWVKQNRDIWTPWIRFPERAKTSMLSSLTCADMGNSSLCDPASWMVLFIQLAFGLLLMCAAVLSGGSKGPGDDVTVPMKEAAIVKAVSEARQRVKTITGAKRGMHSMLSLAKFSKNGSGAEGKMAASAEELAAIKIQSIRRGNLARTTQSAQNRLVQATMGAIEIAVDLTDNAVDKVAKSDSEFKKRLEFLHYTANPIVTISFVRTLENFCLRDFDEHLQRPPIPTSPMIWYARGARSTLYRYIVFSRHYMKLFAVVLSCALFSGVLGTLNYIYMRWETCAPRDKLWGDPALTPPPILCPICALILLISGGIVTSVVASRRCLNRCARRGGLPARCYDSSEGHVLCILLRAAEVLF